MFDDLIFFDVLGVEGIIWGWVLVCVGGLFFFLCFVVNGVVDFFVLFEWVFYKCILFFDCVVGVFEEVDDGDGVL